MPTRHIVICGLSGSTIFIHIISQTARFSKKTLLNIKCVFILSTTSVRKISHSVKNSAIDHKRAQVFILVRFQRNWSFFNRFFQKYSNIKFDKKNCPVGAEGRRTDREKDRHNESSSHFFSILRRRLKYHIYLSLFETWGRTESSQKNISILRLAKFLWPCTQYLFMSVTFPIPLWPLHTGLFEMIVGVLTTATSFSRCNAMWFLSMGLRQGSGSCSYSSRKYPGTEGTNQNRHWNYRRWHATNRLERTRFSCWCL